MTANLYPVDERVWRGGQPRTADDWQELVRRGVKRILKLNAEKDYSDSIAPAFGLELAYLPIADMAQAPPAEAYLHFADEYLRRPGPWLVHCTEGKDRTGLVIARYRVWKCGWSKQAAFDEWVRLGSHGYPGLVAAWKAYAPAGGATT